MFALYLIGYFITFFILFFCRPGVKTPMVDYLDRMGVVTPFNCANGQFSSAMIQALFWPWVLIVLGLILVFFPLILIYLAIFKRDKLN